MQPTVVATIPYEDMADDELRAVLLRKTEQLGLPAPSVIDHDDSA